MAPWRDIAARWRRVVVFGTGLIASAQTLAASLPPSPAPPEAADAARWLSLVVMIILLVAVALFTGLFILRCIQRARERMLAARPTPTESSDVWRLHTLPDEREDAGDGTPFGREGEE